MEDSNVKNQKEVATTQHNAHQQQTATEYQRIGHHEREVAERHEKKADQREHTKHNVHEKDIHDLRELIKYLHDRLQQAPAHEREKREHIHHGTGSVPKVVALPKEYNALFDKFHIEAPQEYAQFEETSAKLAKKVQELEAAQ